MRLTGAGKFLLFVVGLGVLGYAGWTYRNQLPAQIPGTRRHELDAARHL